MGWKGKEGEGGNGLLPKGREATDAPASAAADSASEAADSASD